MDPPVGSGVYSCPITCYVLGDVAYPATDSRPYPIYYKVQVPTVKFDYALDDVLGNTKWRDWDSRLTSQIGLAQLRGCRGNGWIDLDCNYFASDAAITDGRYDVVKMVDSIAAGTTANFLYLPLQKVYVSVKDLQAYRGYREVLGFWRGQSMIPSDFGSFDKTKCPIQMVIEVPRLS
mgnify:CR=1 FL=1